MIRWGLSAGHHDAAISVIEEMQSTRDEPTPTPYALIAACGVALIAPLMLLRRR